MVIIDRVPADNLQKKIQTIKDSGRRILSIAISQFKKDSTRSLEYTVTEFVVVSQ